MDLRCFSGLDRIDGSGRFVRSPVQAGASLWEQGARYTQTGFVGGAETDHAEERVVQNVEERRCLLALLNYSSEREFMETIFGDSPPDVPAAFVVGAISINFVNADRLSLMHEDNLEGMRRHYRRVRHALAAGLNLDAFSACIQRMASRRGAADVAGEAASDPAAGREKEGAAGGSTPGRYHVSAEGQVLQWLEP